VPACELPEGCGAGLSLATLADHPVRAGASRPGQRWPGTAPQL